MFNIYQYKRSLYFWKNQDMKKKKKVLEHIKALLIQQHPMSRVRSPLMPGTSGCMGGNHYSPHQAVPYHTAVHCTIPYCTVPYHTIPYHSAHDTPNHPVHPISGRLQSIHSSLSLCHKLYKVLKPPKTATLHFSNLRADEPVYMEL